MPKDGNSVLSNCQPKTMYVCIWSNPMKRRHIEFPTMTHKISRVILATITYTCCGV